mmetsp:Transcript_46938/g.134218  ORF Transcript_46938/g.134218 Transcript_46938/m.134218 type:complete len:250 (-) Transcript_46938:1327-2076(-)
MSSPTSTTKTTPLLACGGGSLLDDGSRTSPKRSDLKHKRIRTNHWSIGKSRPGNRLVHNNPMDNPPATTTRRCRNPAHPSLARICSGRPPRRGRGRCKKRAGPDSGARWSNPRRPNRSRTGSAPRPCRCRAAHNPPGKRLAGRNRGPQSPGRCTGRAADGHRSRDLRKPRDKARTCPAKPLRRSKTSRVRTLRKCTSCLARKSPSALRDRARRCCRYSARSNAAPRGPSSRRRQSKSAAPRRHCNHLPR